MDYKEQLVREIESKIESLNQLAARYREIHARTYNPSAQPKLYGIDGGKDKK